MAVAHTENRNSAAAEALYRRIVLLRPAAAASYGSWLTVEGRLEESFAQFEASIKAVPTQGFAYYALITGKRFDTIDPTLINPVIQLASDPRLNNLERLYANYALGKLRDGQNDYQGALAAYDHGNELAFNLHNMGRPYNGGQVRQGFDRGVDFFRHVPADKSIKVAEDASNPIIHRRHDSIRHYVARSDPVVPFDGRFSRRIEILGRAGAHADASMGTWNWRRRFS